MIRFRAAASVGAAASLLLGCMPALASGAGAPTSPAVSGGLLVAAGHGLHPMLRSGPGRATTESSENWSGYIRSGAAGTFTRSAASWTVPTVSTTYPGYSSTWVGIDGATSGDDYLIQTGTESDVVNGQARYDAWWEVITPSNEAPETKYGNLPVHPGDAITARVVKGTGGKWTMTLVDKTTGGSGTHTSSYAGKGKSAEWIEEDTDVDGLISPAPDWHSVTFHGITLDGSNPDLRAGDAVDIVDSEGTQEDSTGAPNSTDNGFKVTWLTTGAPSPT